MKTKNIFMLTLLAGTTLPAMAQHDIVDSVAYKDQKVDIGANRLFSREQSTGAVSVISNKDVNKRGARNIGNNILGSGSGLVSLDGSGLFHAQNPTFYIRGIQSSSGSTPLIIVDGVERAIENVVAEDVESVQILKDAAATALYGYKGANGVLIVTTKHGDYNSKSITFSYDHVFSYLNNKPKMADAATYASAVNEAYRNQGEASVYSDAVINAYKNGTNPLYYPNVNWADETFRDVSHNNRFNLEFKGGSNNFRYYTNVQLLTNKGFVKNFENDGYSTQNKYTRGTLRSNMDIDLGPKTKLHTHLYGLLTEQSQPGSQADLWSMIYQLPANAFPIKATSAVWGGNTQYTTNNPVAQSQAAAYYKNHQRALYADLLLEQDLSSITEGLKGSAQLGYDTWSNLYENHSKTYRYSYYAVNNNGDVVPDGEGALAAVEGSDSRMGTASNNDSWIRRCVWNLALNYDRTFAEKHNVYGQLKYDYEYNDQTGTNTSIYRHNISLFGHYGYDNRYLFDVAFVESASNRLAPGSKWAFSPTFSAAWNISNEAFMKNVKCIDFLKLRVSWGNKQLDVLPGDNVWTYYNQFYLMDAASYPFDATYTGTQWGNTYLGTAMSLSQGHEQSSKFNLGLDATLFGSLNLSADVYYQNRYDIWYSTAGSYSSVFGLDAPYENVGRITSKGFEFSADYSKKLNKNLTFSVGGSLTVNKTIVNRQAESPQLFANTSSTGKRYGQAFGYIANGFFQKSDDLDGNGIISEAEMKQLGYPIQNANTIYPGDVKYVDLTGDDKIDSNDRQAIGYSTTAPDLYYNFHLGVEYKGFGVDAMFQGVGKWTGFKTTNGLYRSAVATNTLSQYLYENSWSAERGNTDQALFPRLSTVSNANNDVNSTLNMFDRSYLKLRYVEAYYYLPKTVLDKTNFIKNVKLYVRGTDLFTTDHLDQADAASYGTTQPLTKSLQLGAAVTF
ncbi:SusC/RagA family TonB-linked outer membrane protein [Segatella bryantii]|uniref:SusC/RagA family TonB-linked outer membrane protein n=1 Tax=Segatella bryantii TaxID=77095 RepID=A0ABX4EKG2_SEGBR|nr:SusC/RagA family TonB-linked outer membrane protein [Segatella bryantii]MDR4930618.1 SusC/RagA family TonB-linked outer membrane protein [Segatella bryantii]OYP56158.1 SusC/RagA family TonB-linked outer membrane protein [Segatella bryantii]UKK76608.1 SusC/RagA family TonB-linked outer membrane protein [Segatella bryantii]UKK81249.1 SusC/RagA family TonB-linked outer membrane protein [Segatella bryantii]